MLVAATETVAQPEVRTLPRDTDGAGPVQLDDQAVLPIFTSGPPAQLTAWLADHEYGTCRVELESWLADNSSHQYYGEALFLYGYCAHLANEHELALATLAEAANEVELLADHAFYFAARSAFELEDYDSMVALTLSVPADSVFGPRAQFLRAQALRQSGQVIESVGVLQAFVDSYPNAYYIDQVELELAQGLSEIGELVRAADTFQRVATRYPGRDSEETAREALEDLLPTLPEELRDDYDIVEDEDFVARATTLFDRHRSEQVIELLDDELDRLGRGTPLGCEATYMVGRSYSKLRDHADAVPYYESVIDNGCEDEDLIVKSHYMAGRSLWNVGRDAEAIAHFQLLYTEHPNHTYADDAILYEARIEGSNGNDSQFLSLLEEQVNRFPDGDMLGDANWLLFQHEFDSGNYADAVAFADAVASQTGENSIYNHGRIAYFRARGLEISGDNEMAAVGYAAVANDFPLSYYALMAINRLMLLDSAAAQALVERLRGPESAEETATLTVESAQITEDEAFLRGILLLRLGLLELAQDQFDRLVSQYPNQDDLLWLVSYLYDRAGAYHISHDIPRRQITSFLTEYPTAETVEQWQIAYPQPFLDLVAEAAEERGISPYLIYAIMREESGFNPRAESWANARGLMQLMEGTAGDMADRVGMDTPSRSDLFEPEVAVTLGSEFLLRLADRYDHHPVLNIAGYNGGIGNVDRFIRENGDEPADLFVEDIPFSQTRDYTKRVLMTYWIYNWLYNEEAPIIEIPFELPER